MSKRKSRFDQPEMLGILGLLPDEHARNEDFVVWIDNSEAGLNEECRYPWENRERAKKKQANTQGRGTELTRMVSRSGVATESGINDNGVLQLDKRQRDLDDVNDTRHALRNKLDVFIVASLERHFNTRVVGSRSSTSYAKNLISRVGAEVTKFVESNPGSRQAKAYETVVAMKPHERLAAAKTMFAKNEDDEFLALLMVMFYKRATLARKLPKKK